MEKLSDMTRLAKPTELLYFKGIFDKRDIIIELTNTRENKADVNIIVSIAF